MTEKTVKKKRNKRTLKKKIRRITNIVILFIFLLSGVINSMIAYNLIKYGNLLAADILGRTCSVLVDGDELKKITSFDDVLSEEYYHITQKLEKAFPDFWGEGPIHFSIIKEINGQLISIIDSLDKEFTHYKIDNNNLETLKREGIKSRIENGQGFFDSIAYTPIFDSQGEVVGIFVVRLVEYFQIAIFGISVVLIFILALGGFFIGLIVTRIMTMRITRPLDVLNEKIRMIAKVEGDLSQRITFEKTYREVEDLAEATNMVMERTGHFVELLEEKQHHLRDKNREMAQQTEELEAQTEELIALNENLEEAMRELQDTQVQLVQSEKMASIGQLTAGVAHEINTPLGAINSNTSIIEMVTQFLKSTINIKDNEKPGQLIEKLEKANSTNKLACERIIHIVRNLKNFSRLDQSEFQEACLHEGIESVLLLSHNELKHRIKVHKEFGNIPLVQCFPNQLNQVFMNIIVNAAQAIQEEGDIWIKTWEEDEKVFIQIRDNGAGISKENLKRIFDPGFTTKGVGVGTGLGLSICYKIIQNHHGKITVESTLGEGTTFTILIPVTNSFKEVQQNLL